MEHVCDVEPWRLDMPGILGTSSECQAVPDVTRRNSLLCWFDSRIRESTHGLEIVFDPSGRDDWPVFPVEMLQRMVELPKGISAKRRLVFESLAAATSSESAQSLTSWW